MSGSARNNHGHAQVGPLLTVKQLKERYLFGIIIKDEKGKEVPTSTYQAWIDDAVAMLEVDLDLALTPRTTIEYKDYHVTDYFNWGYMQLNNFPVISVDSMVLTYLRDNNGNDEQVLEIPLAWRRLEKETGIIRMVPNSRFPSNLQVGNTGAFFPELFSRNSYIPDVWRVTYTYGFADGCLPLSINQAVGYLAAIQALNIAGDLVVGAGIASQSVSLDGLSESINTTASAENHAYSAKVKEYQRVMFGANQSERGLIDKLRDYYKGSQLQII